jgi:hypothetical protein
LALASASPRQKLRRAGAVIGEGIDAGEAIGDKLLLEPEALLARHHENLGQKVTVPVQAAPAKLKLDLLAGGKPGKGIFRLIDERPGIVAAPAERRHRRLGPDQPGHPAVAELECLAVDDAGDRAGL